MIWLDGTFLGSRYELGFHRLSLAFVGRRRDDIEGLIVQCIAEDTAEVMKSIVSQEA